jgi:hypothetical protein
MNPALLSVASPVFSAAPFIVIALFILVLVLITSALRRRSPLRPRRWGNRIAIATAIAVAIATAVRVGHHSGGLSVPVQKVAIPSFSVPQPRLRSTTAPSTAQGPAPLWVQDWPQYVAREAPRSARLVHAESLRYAATDEEARADAYDQAAERLLPYVQPRVDSSVGFRIAAPNLRQFLHDSVLSGRYNLVKDEYLEQTVRPYADIWRCTLLIDASPANIDRLAADYRAAAAVTARQNAMTFGSLAGLCGVLVLLYLFLNAVTRGYYAWKLRAAALMLAIVAVLTIFAKMRM